MKTVVAAAALVLAVAVLAGAPAASAATRECNGLQICVPVIGPWVVVPTRGTPRPNVEFQLDCPRGYIVGGLDAELSSTGIDITFAGTLGSPVNPGITTSGSAVFSGTYTGPGGDGPESFRPHVGCIPSSGGGGRVPTSASATFPPGHPTIRRVRNARVHPGTARVAATCLSGERMIAAAHALGFYTQLPPGAGLVAAVNARQAIQGSRAVVTVQAGAPVSGVRAVLQVGVVCAGGK